MKTNFLLKSKRHKPSSGKRAIIIVAAVFIIGAVAFSYLGSPLSAALAPLWRSNAYISRAYENLTASLRSKDALEKENGDLKEALAADSDLIVSLRAVASSRDELLESFGRAAIAGIPASVLVRPPETPYDIIVVDAGENVSVPPAGAVTDIGGAAIGTVSDVLSKTSRVTLYSSAGVRTDAVLERGGVPVTLVGRGGANFSFALARDLPVEVGDRILTAGLDASLVGVVGSIDVSPTDSEKTVLVASPVNPQTLRYVLIKP